MDPLTDCPVCFETYEEEPEGERPPPVGRHWAVKLDCCQQSLCCHCQVCLARCPFCRTRWHPEEDNGDGEHFWQRRSFPNPILTVWGTTLAFDAIRVMASAGISGVRTLAAAAAATAAEASPVVIAGGAAGAVALAGTMALYQASQHRPQHAANLAAQVQSRGRHRLVLLDEGSGSAWSKLVCRLWDAVQWHILPMWDGMPHVYTGSPWRNEGRMRHRQRLHELVNGESRAAGSEEDSRFAEKRLWGDLAFCFMLWLDYNPHTPNWGSCISYGLPPMHLCWHNRWREDMRHVVSDFARYLHSDYIQEAVPEKQRSCAACLVAMLDHVLSWEVTTLDRGSSDLIAASWWRYPDFCAKLQERFAEAWAATQAPPEAEVELRSFETHAEAMAGREVPECFRALWSM